MSYQYRELTDVSGCLTNIEAGLDKFNLGGLIEVAIVPQVYVISMPTTTEANGSFSGTVQLLPGSRLFNVGFLPETGGFTEKMLENDAGVYYDQALTIQIPKDRPEVTTFKNTVKRGRYLIIYRDQNGITKLLHNMRIKVDLDTGKAPSNLNGHTLTASRSTTMAASAYTLPQGSDSVVDAIEMTQLSLYYQEFALPGGVSPGQELALLHPVLFNGAALVFLNQGLRLRPGIHYTIAGDRMTLDIRDNVDAAGPSLIQVWAPAGLVGGVMNRPYTHLETITDSFVSGHQFTLPQTPIDTDHLILTHNQSFALRPGQDYTLSGDTVILLFDGDPLPGDPDTIQAMIWSEVAENSAVTINGFAHFAYTVSRIAQDDFFQLPNTPLPNTLYLRMDSGLLLLEGQDYNNGNFGIINWLIDVEPPNGTGLIDIDVWYAY